MNLLETADEAMKRGIRAAYDLGRHEGLGEAAAIAQTIAARWLDEGAHDVRHQFASAGAEEVANAILKASTSKPARGGP